MLHEVLIRARREVSLLLLVGVLSMVFSILLVTDASIGLLFIGQQGIHSPMELHMILMIVIRACELAFGGAWLSLSNRIMRDASSVRKQYLKRSLRRTIEKLPEAQGRNRAMDLIMDMIGIYRAHYGRLIVVLVLATAVSSLVILGSAYLVLTNLISLEEALLSWTINASVLLIISGLYIETHRRWGNKLLRLEGDQERFTEFLGDIIET